MPWTTATPIILWAVIFIPLTIWLWIKPPTDKLSLLVVLADFILLNILCILVLNWSIIFYYLRALPILFAFGMTIRYLRRLRKKSWLPDKAPARVVVLVISLVILPLAAFLIYNTYQSTHYKDYAGDPALGLFPLRDGLYVTANGGNGLVNSWMNDHVTGWSSTESSGDLSEGYAMDFAKMGIDGTISQGILPDSFLAYDIFTEKVYAPCPGKVVYVEDGHVDVQPFAPASGLGNKVVIQCDNVFFTLANLKNGSLAVAVDDAVGMGQLLGMVGNSGSPSIPHLHVHATTGSWDSSGTPIPVLFDSNFAVDHFMIRNDFTFR
jgi:hypothetical protein